MNDTATQVRIVPMERFHLNDVMRVDKLSYTTPWSLAMFRQELDKRESRHYVVAEIDGRHVGHAGALRIADEGHVTTVVVDPERRNGGIGARLMLDLHQWAIERGLAAMTLEVRVSNAAAIALYRRFGYAPAGVRKNYYADLGEDALVMWAHDVDAPAYAERLDAVEAALPGRTTVDLSAWPAS